MEEISWTNQIIISRPIQTIFYEGYEGRNKSKKRIARDGELLIIKFCSTEEAEQLVGDGEIPYLGDS